MQKIAHVTNVSTTTVHRIIHQFEDKNRIEAKTFTDSLQKLTERMMNLLKPSVKQNPKISNSKLATLREEHYGEKVHARTVLRTLKRRRY